MTDHLPLLKWGSKGFLVEELQSALNDHTRTLSPKLVVDGVFGKLTYGAVRAFQRENPPLEIDGVVGPKTWERINEKLKGALTHKGPDQPKLPGYPVQRTADDCGYFAHYALAESISRGAFNVSFTPQEVFDARDRFLRLTGRSGHVYLGASFGPQMMEVLGQYGFKVFHDAANFKEKVKAADSAVHLINRIGKYGVTIACHKWAGSWAQGHWIAVLGWKRFDDIEYFFVYDSSCTIARAVYNDWKADITVAWVRWNRLAAFLQKSGVRDLIAKP